ncbi:hypothetical protein AAF712_003559 [Marasmius tenuissimus]|uniref:Uncharacterized protein n=1 Tax=Marasmius tenuissimus TaxID=585030 RepID=A0ABR3A7B4_9AGAR
MLFMRPHNPRFHLDRHSQRWTGTGFVFDDGIGPIPNTNSNTAQSLINTSLRFFIAAGDYAGAIVPLKTLVEKLGVQVIGRTYSTLVYGSRTRFQGDATSVRFLLGVEPTGKAAIASAFRVSERALDNFVG